MDDCEVLIVGGGPAGSSCAWALRNSGLDVLLVDRKRFPRDKVCAGWITPQVLTSLEIDADDYARGRVFQPITGFRTGLIGAREIFTPYDRPVSYGIRRCEFDHYLLQRCGARHCDDVPVERIERQAQGWLVNGQFRARMLVGAGGHFCPVARSLGARRSERAPMVTAQEIEFAAADEDLARGTIDAAVPELYFCPDLTGYGWCFRKGKYLNIGLGRTEHDKLAAHVAAFVDFLRLRGKICGEVPGRFHGHAYFLYDQVAPLVCDDAVVLIGDAAGLAYPQSGEGIRPAVESGLLAGQVIARAQGDYGHRRLDPFVREVQARLGPPGKRRATDWLPAGWLQMLAAGLLRSKGFSRNVVLDRWFLHRDEAALRISLNGSSASATAVLPSSSRGR